MKFTKINHTVQLFQFHRFIIWEVLWVKLHHHFRKISANTMYSKIVTHLNNKWLSAGHVYSIIFSNFNKLVKSLKTSIQTTFYKILLISNLVYQGWPICNLVYSYQRDSNNVAKGDFSSSTASQSMKSNLI